MTNQKPSLRKRIVCHLFGHKAERVDWSLTVMGRVSPVKRYVCARCDRPYWEALGMQVNDDDPRLTGNAT